MKPKIKFEHGMQALLPGGTNWQVDAMDWSLPGGSCSAKISTHLKHNHVNTPGDMKQWLGKAITIHNPAGDLLWDGWIEKVRLTTGRLSYQWDINSMNNRVLARYPLVSPILDPYRQWAYSNWVQDDALLDEIGAKESLITLSNANAASAQQAASQSLRPDGEITTSFSLSEAGEDSCLEISAIGWWQRLDWTMDGAESGLLAHLPGGKSKQVFGLSGTEKLAQSFQTATDIFPLGQICLRMALMAAPGDEVRVRVCTNMGGRPGTTIATASLPAYQLQGGWQWLNWQLDSVTHLAANSTYWLVIERSGALDINNHYTVETDDGPGYLQGECLKWNGSDWVALNQDLRFALLAMEESSELIKDIGLQAVAGGVLQGVQVWKESRFNLPRWRTPEQSRKARLEQWLQLGCQDQSRLSALVNADRILEVFSLPRIAGIPITLNSAGRLEFPSGTRLPPPLDLLGRQLNLLNGVSLSPQVLIALSWAPENGLSPLLSE
jgi:hypothetical protein